MSKSGAGSPKPLKIRFNPPQGYPLGVNPTFRICASILIPIMKLVARYEYREGVKIPKSGPAIVVSNHVSYMDAFSHSFSTPMGVPQGFLENLKFLEFQ
jgi:1-acyl-sn-glycerol-3-phosphate acyltransferase